MRRFWLSLVMAALLHASDRWLEPYPYYYYPSLAAIVMAYLAWTSD